MSASRESAPREACRLWPLAAAQQTSVGSPVAAFFNAALGYTCLYYTAAFEITCFWCTRRSPQLIVAIAIAQNEIYASSIDGGPRKTGLNCETSSRRGAGDAEKGEQFRTLICTNHR